MYAGLFMSAIFDLYSSSCDRIERSLIPNGQGLSGQFQALSGNFCYNFNGMRRGELYKSLDFKNRPEKFFLIKINILGGEYVNKPYLVFCYKNKNLRNIFVKNLFDFLNNCDYN